MAGAALAIGAAILLVFTVGADLRASRPPKTTELPGAKPPSPFATPAVSIAGGATFFRDYCSMCHGSNGDGVNGLAPTLAGSTLVKFGTEDELLRMIRKGRLPADADNKSGLQMPPSGGMNSYTEDEMRSVIRYVKTIVR
ncbi:MAG: cytochrome c [Thermoflexales bacterium]